MNYNYTLIDIDFINQISVIKGEILKDNMYEMYRATIIKKEIKDIKQRKLF